ncbi:hypothetical protein PtA15_5A194 [Puccinia triticina]|uniref:Transcription initiation factor TFIID subunit 4 n=1 Tax=Puccinia triticina TaxID=208348 RepID=A0ABY7CHB0_9BASI|nr:uncharacterized protein PtA15_5A194 [Puccinia triticina]WAQ84621.1 hypothetical protein PtA15_5A194 [Puccinia triticina]
MSTNSPTSKRSKLDSPLQQLQNASSSTDDHRPSASGSGSFAAGSATNNNSLQTDFDAMNDAVGIAGVDIAAEEELARTQSNLYRTANRSYSTSCQHHLPHQQQPWLKTPRVKILDFLDKPALTLMVQHIAASFQLKTLEPAILDVLTQAAEARIHSLIVDSIGAKDHRVSSSHLRPPPLYTTSPPKKGKQKEREPMAMYDQIVYEQPERILSIQASISASLEAAGRHGETHEKTGPVKKKKRKREGPGQLARNMSEDARARQSNQTAMRSVGGRSKYSWLSGGVVAAGSKPLSSPLVANLPAPKFAPTNTQGPTHADRPQLGGILSDIHPAHLAETVGLNDTLFALERERGTGAGKDSFALLWVLFIFFGRQFS